ncbi:stage II sporulation protein D [Sinanaerobacter chloroacetimidivorans]|jgi:stage II sporulation protein D|uniref:Stage II sporulation protein D n=1 Tax=Sinanaerobacter chloroacetimidivorans TaxID=2818044 RepID=A0A8J8B463_9FIRM|nr:stage II sporulation protein D [Sinanaerobacter chloroacetimidivorans]MBR0600446.1 stage II sporulation protein D [Sinanaerobacter chloroacetimidivorans]
MNYKRDLLKGLAITTVLVLFSLVLLPFTLVSLFSGNDEQAPIAKDPNYEPSYIKVYRHDSGKTETIEFEEYVKGVVAGEMPSSFEMEALKAQAVAARTYSLSKIVRSGDGGNPDHPSAPVCDDTHCQVYRSVDELKEIKSAEWMATGWPRIVEAVDSTRGELMYYQGALVEQPLFHSSSGGKTENSEDVFVSALPYLRSVDSPYETEAPHQHEQITISLSEFSKKIKKAYPKENVGTINSSTIKVTNRSEGGRVATIKVGNLSLKGRDIRDLFGLRSANFAVSFQGDSVVFTTEGYGHGVGMSQWGANGMAQQGFTYKEILTHYYSGVEIRK